jgi:hypothetical protein
LFSARIELAASIVMSPPTTIEIRRALAVAGGSLHTMLAPGWSVRLGR